MFEYSKVYKIESTDKPPPYIYNDLNEFTIHIEQKTRQRETENLKTENRRTEFAACLLAYARIYLSFVLPAKYPSIFLPSLLHISLLD